MNQTTSRPQIDYCVQFALATAIAKNYQDITDIAIPFVDEYRGIIFSIAQHYNTYTHCKVGVDTELYTQNI